MKPSTSVNNYDIIQVNMACTMINTSTVAKQDCYILIEQSVHLSN